MRKTLVQVRSAAGSSPKALTPVSEVLSPLPAKSILFEKVALTLVGCIVL